MQFRFKAKPSTDTDLRVCAGCVRFISGPRKRSETLKMASVVVLKKSASSRQCVFSNSSAASTCVSSASRVAAFKASENEGLLPPPVPAADGT